MLFSVAQRRARPSQRAYNSQRTWADRVGLIVTMTDDRGNSVCSEAAPLPGFSPDNIDVARNWLLRHQANRYPNPKEGTLDELLGTLEPHVRSAPASARFAIEFAFLQLAAKRLAVPLRNLLSVSPVGTTTLPSAVLVDLHAPDLVETLQRLAQSATAAVKVKVGVSLDSEMRALEHLRVHLPSARLRADANGAWSPEEARLALGELARFEVEFVEEPFQLSRPVAARELPPFAIALAWDESLFGHNPEEAWLQDWLSRQDCQVLVLKPMCVGGCAVLRDWVRMANAAGLEVVFSHLFDGSYAAHVYAELAAAWGSRKLAMGLGQRRESLPW